MITRITIFLALFLAGVYIPANAQSSALTDAYDTWKAEITKQHGGMPSNSYALTSVTERTGAQSATVKFLVNGKMPVLDLAICPLNITRGADGKVVNILRGEQVNAKQQLDPTSKRAAAELNTTIPVNAQTNAVEVKWKFAAEGTSFEYTMILPLEDSATANVLGIVPSNGDPVAGKPLCPTGCYEVSASTERCGFFYNCCRTPIGNSIDFTTCTVTCAQGC